MAYIEPNCLKCEKSFFSTYRNIFYCMDRIKEISLEPTSIPPFWCPLRPKSHLVSKAKVIHEWK